MLEGGMRKAWLGNVTFIFRIRHETVRLLNLMYLMCPFLIDAASVHTTLQHLRRVSKATTDIEKTALLQVLQSRYTIAGVD